MLPRSRRTSPDGFDDFGYSVAIDGATAIVGAISKGELYARGAAYVFERTPGGWVETQELEASDSTAWAFGWSVALEGDRALIGAKGAAALNPYGKAYVFEREATGWVKKAKLVPNPSKSGDGFGAAVALDGDRALIGAPYAWTSTSPYEGLAFVFGRNPKGSWTQKAKFSPADLGDADRFGHDVAILGDVHLLTLDPGAHLSGDVGSVSVSRGGTQELQLGACPQHAGHLFRLGGTFSGTSPGFVYQGLSVPLNPDPYFFYTLASPGIPLGPLSGPLDASGRAYASFTVPPGSQPFLVGLELHHAYGVLDAATQQVELVSNPVPVALLP